MDLLAKKMLNLRESGMMMRKQENWCQSAFKTLVVFRDWFGDVKTAIEQLL